MAYRSTGVLHLAGLLFALYLLDSPLRAQTNGQPGSEPADRTVPAFSILDSSLMSLEHISPLHATSITLFSTLRNDDLLPRDIAFEHLPWLSPARGRAPTVLDQYSRLAEPGVGETLLRYFAVSLAISQGVTRVGHDEPVSQVSIGLRSFVLDGRFRAGFISLVDQYRKASAALDAAERALKNRPDDQPPDVAAEEEMAKRFGEERVLSQQIATADKNRVGFLLETGIAQALEVPRNTLADASIARRAVWLSPIYRFERVPVDVAGLIRFNDERRTASKMVDFGGRAGVRRNGVLFAIEGLGRRRFLEQEDPSLDLLNGRLVGAITHGFNRSTQVTFTFGKNFKNDFAQGGSLLASFGMTMGLGESLLGVLPDGE
jgi:hypothetical protein